MACCRQATSHYLKQCWSRSPEPYGVTRQQWVYSGLHSYYYHSASDCFFYSVPKWWSDMLYFITFRWFHYWYIIISHVCSLSKSLFNLNSCPSTSEVTLQDMDEKDATDAKHRKVWTVCMVRGKCCHVNGVCLSPGGHCWSYYPGSLSSLSGDYSSFEDWVLVDEIYDLQIICCGMTSW